MTGTDLFFFNLLDSAKAPELRRSRAFAVFGFHDAILLKFNETDLTTDLKNTIAQSGDGGKTVFSTPKFLVDSPAIA